MFPLWALFISIIPSSKSLTCMTSWHLLVQIKENVSAMLSFVPDTMFWNLQFSTSKQAMSNNVFKLLVVPLKVIKDPRIFLSSEPRHFLLIHLLLKGFGQNPRHFNYHKKKGDLMVTRLWKGKHKFLTMVLVLHSWKTLKANSHRRKNILERKRLSMQSDLTDGWSSTVFIA